MNAVTTPPTFAAQLSAVRAQPTPAEHTSACWDRGRCLAVFMEANELQVDGLFAPTGTIPTQQLVEACDESDRREGEYAACAAEARSTSTRSMA